MATISIKENLSVSNKDKIYEIAKALKEPKDASLRPAHSQGLSENMRSLWFKR